MKKEIMDWFKYNHESNLKFIEILETEKKLNPKIFKIFSHILVSHQIWLGRLNPTKKQETDPWAKIEEKKFGIFNDQLLIDTNDLIQTIHSDKSINGKVKYHNSKGIYFENSIKEILSHLIAHSSYHRGQVALLLRENNIDPPVSDYIFYKRQPH